MTKPKDSICTRQIPDTRGPWSVSIDDRLVHEQLNEQLAWNLFRSRCSHHESVGFTVFLRKNEKIIAHQKVK
jgi:hypothetical protein